jgi:hypothetical protein
MSANNKDPCRFTPSQVCEHCGSDVPMVIVASHSPNGITDDLSQYKNQDQERIVYELLSCPICEAVTLRRYCTEHSKSHTERAVETLYSEKENRSIGVSKDGRNQRSVERAKARSIMIRRLAVIHECNSANYYRM